MLRPPTQDPSHFISIVETPDMADALIQRSPLEFDYAPPKQSSSSIAAISPPTTTTTNNHAKKTFLVKIMEQNSYPHKTRIREMRVNGHWAENADHFFQQDSIPKAALQKVVPQDMAWQGLTDWESSGQLDEDAPPASWLSTKSDFVQARRMRRTSQAGSAERGGLLGIWGERKEMDENGEIKTVVQRLDWRSAEKVREREKEKELSGVVRFT
jgi:hypothetical protein